MWDTDKTHDFSVRKEAVEQSGHHMDLIKSIAVPLWTATCVWRNDQRNAIQQMFPIYSHLHTYCTLINVKVQIMSLMCGIFYNKFISPDGFKLHKFIIVFSCCFNGNVVFHVLTIHFTVICSAVYKETCNLVQIIFHSYIIIVPDSCDF